jgi:hypothetical protein
MAIVSNGPGRQKDLAMLLPYCIDCNAHSEMDRMESVL